MVSVEDIVQEVGEHPGCITLSVGETRGGGMRGESGGNGVS